MNNYQKFQRDRQFVELENGERVGVPEYIGKRLSGYRFNESEKIIETNCYDCKKWILVLKLEEDLEGQKEWKQIHNEVEIHYQGYKSGFEYKCNKCTGKVKEKRREPKVENKGFDGAMGDVNKKADKYTVFLTSDNRKYFQLRSLLEGVNKKNLINRIFDEERARKPILEYLS